jgi:hypothetical protein
MRVSSGDLPGSGPGSAPGRLFAHRGEGIQTFLRAEIERVVGWRYCMGRKGPSGSVHILGTVWWRMAKTELSRGCSGLSVTLVAEVGLVRFGRLALEVSQRVLPAQRTKFS